jgi:hypothetical protein
MARTGQGLGHDDGTGAAQAGDGGGVARWGAVGDIRGRPPARQPHHVDPVLHRHGNARQRATGASGPRSGFGPLGGGRHRSGVITGDHGIERCGSVQRLQGHRDHFGRADMLLADLAGEVDRGEAEHQCRSYPSRRTAARDSHAAQAEAVRPGGETTRRPRSIS